MVSGYGDLTGSGTNHQITRMGPLFLWLRADVPGAVDLHPLHPSQQTYRGPMSAPGTKADHLQSGDRRRLVIDVGLGDRRRLVMRWTAPTSGIAMCQNAVAIYERREGEPPMSEVAT